VAGKHGTAIRQNRRNELKNRTRLTPDFFLGIS
jgi:hypothetical protein